MRKVAILAICASIVIAILAFVWVSVEYETGLTQWQNKTESLWNENTVILDSVDDAGLDLYCFYNEDLEFECQITSPTIFDMSRMLKEEGYDFLCSCETASDAPCKWICRLQNG